MGAEDLLVIITWAVIALCLIGMGVIETRKRDAQRSQIFERGNEKWAELYVRAIVDVEQEWAERQRT